MKITILGTGTPTHRTKFQTSILVQIGEDYLLFDAGRGTVHQLHQAGFDLKRLTAVFITHHHFDHINDLFDVMISTSMAGRTHTLPIYGPKGTQRIVNGLIEHVYANDIRFRLEEDKKMAQYGNEWAERPESITAVNVTEIEAGLVAEAADWRIMSQFVRHGDFSDVPDFEWNCLGYRIETKNNVLAFSGDSVDCDGLAKLAQDADALIQCCHIPKRATSEPAMNYFAQTILPSSGEVGQIAAQANVKHLVITHMGHSIDESNIDEVVADIQQDYAGEIVVAQDLMHLQLNGNQFVVDVL